MNIKIKTVKQNRESAGAAGTFAGWFGFLSLPPLSQNPRVRLRKKNRTENPASGPWASHSQYGKNRVPSRTPRKLRLEV